MPSSLPIPSRLDTPPPALGCSSGETEAHTENTARELPPLVWPGAQLAVTTGPSTLQHEETAPAEGRRVGGRHFLWSDGRARLRAWPEAAACQPRSSGEGGREGGGAAAPSGPRGHPAAHREEGCRAESEAPCSCPLPAPRSREGLTATASQGAWVRARPGRATAARGGQTRPRHWLRGAPGSPQTSLLPADQRGLEIQPQGPACGGWGEALRLTQGSAPRETP